MSAVDSTYAWIRLAIATVLGTIGSVGMWSFVVALPSVQADFAILRNEASLPYTLAMIGFAFGGVALGKLADRYGIVFPAICGTLLLGFGYLLAGYAPNIWTLAAAHAVIGIGTSATFGPVVADMSHWFRKRRGIAIGIASCGNYLSGAIWPPIIQHFIESNGWRTTHIAVGLFCVVTMVPLALMLRRPSPVETVVPGVAVVPRDTLGLRHLFSAPPRMAFFDGGAGLRILLGEPEGDATAHGSALLYYKVPDIDAAHATLVAAKVAVGAAPHFVARMPDHELWLATYLDGEGNTFALMCEKR